MPHTGLAIIESRWWKNGNDTVRPLFETLAGIVEDNPHSVRYDMFVENKSLKSVISDITKQKHIHSIYIGAHGNNNSIFGLAKTEISRTSLRNILRSVNKKGSVERLYFGSCLIATSDNASYLLKGTPKTGLQWVAGYTKSIDWVDSSAVDMIFWSKNLHERKTNRSKKNNKKSSVDMVKTASSQMKTLMPNVFDQMGFNVYYLDTGNNLTSVW